MKMRKLLSRREELWGELPLPESTSYLFSNEENRQQYSNTCDSGAHLGEGHEIEMNDEDQREYLVRAWLGLSDCEAAQTSSCGYCRSMMGEAY